MLPPLPLGICIKTKPWPCLTTEGWQWHGLLQLPYSATCSHDLHRLTCPAICYKMHMLVTGQYRAYLPYIHY